MVKRSTTVVALVLATIGAVFVLAACTSQKSASPGPVSTVFNNADVSFAQQMIVNHRQALMLAEMAQTHAQDPRVMKLALQIEADQESQIETVSRWLQAWRQPVPARTPVPSTTHMPSMMPMPSMTPVPDMSQMMSAPGAQFDQMFLTTMIAYHQQAVEMAKAELTSGANPQAQELAKNIVTTHTAQINKMRQMLASPSPAHS